MKRKVKISIISSVALLSIASFIILISCGGLGDLIPDIVFDTIWDVLGYNKPANLNALALSDSQVLLTWEDKVTGENGFVIEVSIDYGPYSELEKVDKNEITYFHKGLNPDTFCVYKMYAFDDDGQSDYSNVAFCKTQDAPSSAPDAPTNLQAVAISDTQIGLEWVDNSNNEDGFKIEISFDNGSTYDPLDTVNANITSYTSDELAPLNKYYYKVIAYNSYDDSAGSNVASATTQDTPVTPPSAPTSLLATAVSNMRIDLSWTDNSDDEEVFYIQISTNGSTFTDIAKVKPNVTTYESTSLKPETTYYYRVYAANAVGNSGYSNNAKATTKPTPGSAPKPPTNLQAKAVSDVQIKIAWTDNSLDEDGFNIEMAIDEGNTGIEPDPKEYRWIAKVKPNETSYLASSLKPDITFWFRVNAYNFYGSSSYSNSASARTLPYTGSVPAAPTNLVAKAYSDTQIAIAWYDNSSNEDGFNIELSTDGSTFKWWTKVEPNTKEYLVNGLKPNYKFYFRVNAFNKYGASAYSNVASATTNSTPGTVPAAPSNLVAKAASDTQIDMQWTDNSDNEECFIIEVSEDGVRFGTLDKVKPDQYRYSLGGLKPNLTLYFRVYACNSYGNSGYSNVAKATTLPEPGTVPAAPTNLAAKAVSDAQIAIYWRDNSSNEDGFNIYISENGTDFKWFNTVGPNVKEYLVEGLKPDLTLWFKVNAFNKQGKSEFSNTASATTLPAPTGKPAAPTNLVAKAASDTVIELAWTDNSDNEDAFNIEISKNGTDFDWWAKVKPNTTGYSVSGLRPNTPYWFQVNAMNAEGASDYSNVATATTKPTPGTAPAAPTNLVAKAISHTQIAIAWTDNSNNEDGFNVEISVDGVNFSYFDKVGPDVMEYIAEGLKPLTTYYFRVNAFNSYGKSSYSNLAKVTTLEEPAAVPAAPTNLVAKAASDTVIELGWTDNSNNEDAFNIEISTNGTDFKWIDKVKPDTTGYKVGSLRPSTQYWFRVNAINAQGPSDYSNVATATTNSPPGSAPAKPTNLVAKALSDTVIALGWTDNSDNEEGFNIEISTNGTDFSYLNKVGANVKEYSAGGLKPETIYYFRVYAYNSYGKSEVSNVADAKTQQTPGSAPKEPTNLIAAAKSDTVIALGWMDNSDNEEGFNIEISTDGTTFSYLGKVGTNVKEYAAGGLKPETTYYFRVYAYNSYGKSALSNVAKATTLAQPASKPDAPEGLEAFTKSDTVIYITWQDMSDNEDGFNIEISTNGTDFKYLDKVKTNMTEYGVEGLRANTQYWFRVNAFNAQGTSGYSDTATATTNQAPGTVPNAPTSLGASARSDTVIALTWTDNATNEEGFNIEISTNGTDFKYFGKVSANTKDYKVEGLKPYTQYWFRVNAYNKQGNSTYSNTATATTFESPTSPPAAPTGLSATAASGLVIMLEWTDNSSVEEGFIIEVGPDGLKWETLDRVGSDVERYKVSGLKAGVKYYFRVCAFNKAGNSAYSEIVSAIAIK